MKSIGILGGTFDPPHIGHFIIADEVKHALQLDEIWFIPTNEPPHKKEATSNNEHRVAMLKRVITSIDYFHLNVIEMERVGKSYTIDTIKLLKERYPNTKFHFIIGADMVEYLPKWHKIDELMTLVEFVGVRRPNYSLQTDYPIIEVKVPQIDISSTCLKERIKKNQPFKYFVPESIYQYVKDERIYE